MEEISSSEELAKRNQVNNAQLFPAPKMSVVYVTTDICGCYVVILYCYIIILYCYIAIIYCCVVMLCMSVGYVVKMVVYVITATINASETL